MFIVFVEARYECRDSTRLDTYNNELYLPILHCRSCITSVLKARERCVLRDLPLALFDRNLISASERGF